MTATDLNLYLKKSLDFPSLDFVWSDEHNSDFFTFLDKNFPKNYLKENENLLEIKAAFQNYFEPIGYILFQIKNYKIRLKIFPYKDEPKDSKNIDTIVDIILDNEDMIMGDYNGKSDQILIKDELKRKIFDYVSTLEDEKIHKKELVKFAVREAFELKQNDIVMVKQESIFIKLCDVAYKNEILESKKNTIANRYNGIPENELSAFNTEHFSSRGDREFFVSVAKLFVNKYFLEKNISNFEYEKNVFGYIQAIITQQLIITFDNCEDFFKGLSGFVFRIHFEEVFENIAQIILEEVAMSNAYVIEFLKYYSLNIIVVDGKKYKVPSLETQSGLKWNVVSMLSIVKLYMKTKFKRETVACDLEKKESEMALLIKDGLTPIESNKICMEEKKNITNKIVKNDNELEKNYDSLKLIKNEKEKINLQNEIALIKKDMQLLREENKKILNKAPTRSDVNKYAKLENEFDSIARKLRRENRILEQNEESFISIQTALVKALVSKKQLL